jgi:hypothetical protein
MLLALLLILAQQTVVMRVAVTIPVDPPSALVAQKQGRQGFPWPWPLHHHATVWLTWNSSPDLTTPAKANTGYRVYRSRAGAAFTILNSTLLTGLNYTDTNVQREVQYSYYVTALIGKVESKPSNTVTVVP